MEKGECRKERGRDGRRKEGRKGRKEEKDGEDWREKGSGVRDEEVEGR